MNDRLIVLPKTEDESNSQYAYRVLYYNLIRFTLCPGQKLNEKELTGALGISSTPFRQALFRLREEGFVDIRSQSSTTVSYIDYNLLQENMFIRSTLESAVIEQLCEQGLSASYQEQLKENLKLQSLYVDNATNRERFFDLDNSFHKLLFEAAGKPWSYITVCRSCAQFDRIRFTNVFTQPGGEYASVSFFYNDHLSIFDAILHRDHSRMAERIRHHLYGGKQMNIPASVLQYIIHYPDTEQTGIAAT